MNGGEGGGRGNQGGVSRRGSFDSRNGALEEGILKSSEEAVVDILIAHQREERSQGGSLAEERGDAAAMLRNRRDEANQEHDRGEVAESTILLVEVSTGEGSGRADSGLKIAEDMVRGLPSTRRVPEVAKMNGERGGFTDPTLDNIRLGRGPGGGQTAKPDREMIRDASGRGT
jgi:hypothetical protein